VQPTDRRTFLKSAALAAAPAVRTTFGQSSPNDRVNVAVVGFHGRGAVHYRNYAAMPNVRVVALCDVDERLFPGALASVEKIAGYRPETVVDFRKLIERKDIDAVSIATPDYWHALMTVWACQAGKDVYVEKPCSFTVVEGRKMVDAARKYKRIVQAGQNVRSEGPVRGGIRFLHEGKMGQVYRGKVRITKPRASIGHATETSIPQGVHWDLFLGPSPYKAFTPNRLHYGWHFFKDTTTNDLGNTGVHSIDTMRWALNKNAHPVKIHSTGGYFIWDSDQETPNVQLATFEYADGTLFDFEITNVYSPPGGESSLVYTTEGFVTTSQQGWKPTRGTFKARVASQPPAAGAEEGPTSASFPSASYVEGPVIEAVPSVTHFENFIACVRSRKVEALYCDVLEGHQSASMCHLANISFWTGRKITFDPDTETIIGDPEANARLTRAYRAPYTMPDKV
jgi:predicted dehydrogenase